MTYLNSSQNPTTTARTIAFQANDGTVSSNVVNKSLTVVAVNDAPTLNVIPDPAAILEDAGLQTVNLSGITAGGGETQTLSVTATSGNPGLIPNPTVTYTSPNATGSLSYTPVANQNGTAIITVTVMDNGGTANGGVNTFQRTFTVNVTAVNDPPVALAKDGGNVQSNMRRTAINASLLTGVTDVDNGVNGCVSTSFSVASITSSTGGLVTGVNLGAGTFDFEPTAGFTGAATVFYAVSDTGCPGPGATSAAAAISLTVTGPVIWFVDPAAGVNGDGRLATPFNSLASANTAKGATVNQRIFVSSGTTASGVGVTLAGDTTQATAQWLVGQGATSSPTNTFDALMGISPPAGTIPRPSIGGARPTIQGTVTLNGNNVRTQGFNISAGTSAGMNDGAAITGVSVSELSVTTSTGTAVLLSDTAGTLSFTSISANGGSNGISLTNTTGTFTVNGDGTNTARGGNATGGTIQNMVGADGAAAGNGVFLSNAANVTLRRMQLNGFANSAIRGLSVTNFTFQYGTINGVSGNSSGPTEGALTFGTSNPSGANGLFGTNLIDYCNISGAVEHNVEWYNQSGTGTLTVSNSDIKSNSVAFGSDGILVEMQGTAGASPGSPVTLVVNNVTFDDNKSQGVQVAANDSSRIDATINNSTLIRTSQGNEGFVLSNGSNGQLTAHVTNNNISGLGGVAIFVGQTPGNALALPGGVVGLTAVIRGNVINAPASATNHAVLAFLTSTVGQVSLANILIESNTIVQNGLLRAFLVDTPDLNTTPSWTATVLNNNVTVTDTVNGVTSDVTARRGTGCFDVRGNVISGPFGIRVRQAAPGTVQLEQGVSGSADPAIVLDDNHPVGTVTSVLGTPTVVGNGTCMVPPS